MSFAIFSFEEESGSAGPLSEKVKVKEHNPPTLRPAALSAASSSHQGAQVSLLPRRILPCALLAPDDCLRPLIKLIYFSDSYEMILYNDQCCL